jgi:hypothetical protein
VAKPAMKPGWGMGSGPFPHFSLKLLLNFEEKRLWRGKYNPFYTSHAIKSVTDPHKSFLGGGGGGGGMPMNAMSWLPSGLIDKPKNPMFS